MTQSVLAARPGRNVYWLYGATGAAHPLTCDGCTTADGSSTVTFATEAVVLAFAGTTVSSEATGAFNITAAQARGCPVTPAARAATTSLTRPDT